MTYFKKFKQFDSITELRLINAFFVAIGIALLSPIIISLKGIYLTAWLISIFIIIQTLAVKTNKLIVNNLTIEQMFRISIFMQFLFIILSGLYFYSPLLMVLFDSIIGIIEVSFFTSFSIALNNYITKNCPDDMSDFQVIRNSSSADGFLLGLIITTIINYLFSIGATIIVFIVFNICYTLWLLSKWNFYKGNKYCTTLHINNRITN